MVDNCSNTSACWFICLLENVVVGMKKEPKKKKDVIRIKKTHLMLYISLFLAFIVFFLAFSNLVERTFVRTEVSSLDISLSVFSKTDNKTKLGVSADTDYLNYGKIPVGGNSTKIITISNSNEFVSKSILMVEGNVSPYITPNNTEFFLNPSETKEVRIKAVGKKAGNYTGILKIYTKIPRNRFAELVFM